MCEKELETSDKIIAYGNVKKHLQTLNHI